jgi:hypothetical protein
MFSLVKKVVGKVKEIAKKVVHAITEAKKKRVERTLNWEMHQYYKSEYGNNFLDKHPYYSVYRRD